VRRSRFYCTHKNKDGQVKSFRTLWAANGALLCVLLLALSANSTRHSSGDETLRSGLQPVSGDTQSVDRSRDSLSRTAWDSQQDEHIHAISPDEPSVQTPIVSSVHPSTAEPSPGTPSASSIEAPSGLSSSNTLQDNPAQPLEVLRVISNAEIRNGPSSSATVIGTATPGAQLQVKNRSGDWIQFTDPNSGNGGWIESRRVGPLITEVAEPLQPQPTQQLRPAKPRVQPPKPVAKKKAPFVQEHQLASNPRAPNRYVELPEDQDFTRQRRRGYRLFLRRRMYQEDAGLLSPGFMPPR
jgi:SH3 domain-containing protein